MDQQNYVTRWQGYDEKGNLVCSGTGEIESFTGAADANQLRAYSDALLLDVKRTTPGVARIVVRYIKKS